MSILVAGASANTGSKLVEILAAKPGLSVKALVRNPSKVSTLAALPNVTFVKVNHGDGDGKLWTFSHLYRSFLTNLSSLWRIFGALCTLG